MVVEQVDIHIYRKDDSRHRLYTIYKNQLKMDRRPKHKVQN